MGGQVRHKPFAMGNGVGESEWSWCGVPHFPIPPPPCTYLAPYLACCGCGCGSGSGEDRAAATAQDVEAARGSLQQGRRCNLFLLLKISGFVGCSTHASVWGKKPPTLPSHCSGNTGQGSVGGYASPPTPAPCCCPPTSACSATDLLRGVAEGDTKIQVSPVYHFP